MNILSRAKENPFIGFVFLFIFLMPWNINNGQMSLLSIILLIWWMIIGRKKGYFSKLKNIFHTTPLVLLIFFLLYAYGSLLWSQNIAFGIDSTLNFYKYYWIMVPILFTALSRQDALWGMYVLIFSFSVYGVLSLMIFLDIIHIPSSSPRDPKGHLAYAVVTAYMGLGSLLAMAAFFFATSKKSKVFFLACFAICTIGLFINQGRASQLAFLGTIVVLAIVYRKYIFTNLKISLAFLGIASIAFLLFSQTSQFDRFAQGFKELQHIEEKHFAGSWGQRAYMWYASAHIIKQEPLFGVGVGDNIDAFIDYTKEHPSEATWLRSFHNQHLDYLTKFGLIGYMVFLLGIYALLRKCSKSTIFGSLGIIFFSFVFINSLGDILLLMKPFNNIYMLVFILITIGCIRPPSAA
ncbi:O-antigen ligase family protein [Sulfurospirillum sp. T05]|uniref:O-antigen ligase family protein n=1 Tax=Sulfurospirillum tamanense TaxID=2813362 RepID=A0ABS2WSP3_9BACT|nr:O-antigen ligase family protein [Sulfurospirillum tamanensis]MBN2964660.1 O-antigen ligase family protein [Sulfurospirillum tamanensis]